MSDEETRNALIVIAGIGGLLLTGAGVVLFVNLLLGKTEQDFTFRQHWGGFGGGSTGWRASRALMTFLAGALMVGLGAFTLTFLLKMPVPGTPPPATPPAQEATPATPAAAES